MLAAHLAGRLCHDLISPVSAIVSGLDLLEDPSAQDMREEAMGLIATSARKLADLLSFSRVAFGASAYIDKSASLEEIANTVRAVLDGEIFAPAEGIPADSFAQRAAQLTPQQWRVLALMVHGDQNKQIAYKLGVGEATVKAHVTVILRKLGVRSRTQAVIEARGLALPQV